MNKAITIYLSFSRGQWWCGTSHSIVVDILLPRPPLWPVAAVAACHGVCGPGSGAHPTLDRAVRSEGQDTQGRGEGGQTVGFHPSCSPCLVDDKFTKMGIMFIQEAIGWCYGIVIVMQCMYAHMHVCTPAYIHTLMQLHFSDPFYAVNSKSVYFYVHKSTD